MAGPDPPGEAVCQWPCSSDHTRPGNAGNAEFGSVCQNSFSIATPPRTTISPITANTALVRKLALFTSLTKQHFLYFFPLPQGHGSFRLIFIRICLLKKPFQMKQKVIGAEITNDPGLLDFISLFIQKDEFRYPTHPKLPS